MRKLVACDCPKETGALADATDDTPTETGNEREEEGGGNRVVIT